MAVFLNLLWVVTSCLMILVILIQRGRGGGLAGAFGGLGGSSAFGTRAGDVFTKITVGIFVFWLLLAMILVRVMTKESKFQNVNVANQTAPEGKSQSGPGESKATDASPPEAEKAGDLSGAGQEPAGKAADAKGTKDKAEPDAKPVTETATKSQSKPADAKGSEPKAKPSAKPVAKTAPKAQSKPVTKPAGDATDAKGAGAKAKPDAKPAAKATPKAQSKPDAKPVVKGPSPTDAAPQKAASKPGKDAEAPKSK